MTLTYISTSLFVCCCSSRSSHTSASATLFGVPLPSLNTPRGTRFPPCCPSFLFFPHLSLRFPLVMTGIPETCCLFLSPLCQLPSLPVCCCLAVWPLPYEHRSSVACSLSLSLQLPCPMFLAAALLFFFLVWELQAPSQQGRSCFVASVVVLERRSGSGR